MKLLQLGVTVIFLHSCSGAVFNSGDRKSAPAKSSPAPSSDPATAAPTTPNGANDNPLSRNIAPVEAAPSAAPMTPFPSPTTGSPNAPAGISISPGKPATITPGKPSPNSNQPLFSADEALQTGPVVQRVGVNFEDGGMELHPTQPAPPDYDYNDAVLCFVGTFKVLGATVVSTKAQTVGAAFTNVSGCNTAIKVEIKDRSGVTKYGPQVSRLNAKTAAGPAAPTLLNLNFSEGDQLVVSLDEISCAFTPPVVASRNYGMSHQRALVQPDVCNTNGQ